MKTTVKWYFFTPLMVLFIPDQASALMLGDIKLNSYIDQPLAAQISVLPDQVGELGDIHIRLASEDDYEKAGIEHRTPPGLIKFRLVEGKDGIPAIELTSRDPIKEPLLDFILEVTWPQGHLMREYTVFLDPPAADQEPSPPAIALGHKVENGQAVVQRATALETQSPVMSTRPIEPRLTRDTYGPTMRPDTLWAIAKAVRPDNTVSIQQVMLAMVKKNPEAFYGNNVNRLKAGYVLRIPDKDLINQVSEVGADREVTLQYRRWKQSQQGKRPAADTTQEVTPGEERVNSQPLHPAAAVGAVEDRGGVAAQRAGEMTAPRRQPNDLIQADER